MTKSIPRTHIRRANRVLLPAVLLAVTLFGTRAAWADCAQPVPGTCDPTYKILNVERPTNGKIRVSPSTCSCSTWTNCDTIADCGSGYMGYCWEVTSGSAHTHNIYPPNTVLYLTAIPNANYVFLRWELDASGGQSTTLAMDASKQIRAVFGPPTDKRITYSISPTTAGSLSFSPTPSSSGTGWVEYPHGTNVQITPNAATDWRFTHWDGGASGSANPLNLTLTSDVSIVANYESYYQRIYYSVSPAGSGSVSFDPAPASGRSGPGWAEYPNDTAVTLTALPASGRQFEEWLGSPAPSLLSVVTVTMDADKTATATFRAVSSAVPANLVTDLDLFRRTYLSPIASIGGVDSNGITFDDAGVVSFTGNGMPDAAEFYLIQRAYFDTGLDLSVRWGMVGAYSGSVSFGYSVEAAWDDNYTYIASLIGGAPDYVGRVITAYVTLGNHESVAYAAKFLVENYSVTLDPLQLNRCCLPWIVGEYDADNDAATNYEEWIGAGGSLLPATLGGFYSDATDGFPRYTIAFTGITGPTCSPSGDRGVIQAQLVERAGSYVELFGWPDDRWEEQWWPQAANTTPETTYSVPVDRQTFIRSRVFESSDAPWRSKYWLHTPHDSRTPNRGLPLHQNTRFPLGEYNNVGGWGLTLQHLIGACRVSFHDDDHQAFHGVRAWPTKLPAGFTADSLRGVNTSNQLDQVTWQTGEDDFRRYERIAAPRGTIVKFTTENQMYGVTMVESWGVPSGSSHCLTDASGGVEYYFSDYGYETDSLYLDIIISEPSGTPYTCNALSGPGGVALLSAQKDEGYVPGGHGFVPGTVRTTKQEYRDTFVNYTAMPHPGYRFKQWQGAPPLARGTIYTQTISGKLPGASSYIPVAEFEPDGPFYLETRCVGLGGCSDMGGMIEVKTASILNTFDAGDAIRVKAWPHQGYQFVGWEAYPDVACKEEYAFPYVDWSSTLNSWSDPAAQIRIDKTTHIIAYFEPVP